MLRHAAVRSGLAWRARLYDAIAVLESPWTHACRPSLNTSSALILSGTALDNCPDFGGSACRDDPDRGGLPVALSGSPGAWGGATSLGTSSPTGTSTCP